MANYRTFKNFTEAKAFAVSVNALEFNYDVEFGNYEVYYK